MSRIAGKTPIAEAAARARGAALWRPAPSLAALRLLLLLPLLALAAPAQAAFERATSCTGAMRFYNDDGSFETYALRFAFEGPRYRIEATSESGEVEPTDDRGQCASYLGAGCRHSYPDGAGGEGFYDFRLEPRGGQRYFYAETWPDGTSGTALLTCDADPAAAGN